MERRGVPVPSWVKALLWAPECIALLAISVESLLVRHAFPFKGLYRSAVGVVQRFGKTRGKLIVSAGQWGGPRVVVWMLPHILGRL